MSRTVPALNQPTTASKPEVQFRFFSHLPPELRRKIYLLATPPRVVYVQEDGRLDEEWEDRFEELVEICRTTPIQFKLHPDIAYFAHNWRPRLYADLIRHPQRRLESFGFTSSKKRNQPWIPTPEAPEIPSHVLAENPEAAWAMTRSASLSSPAAIPPFLHVCTESREELKRYGYQLSFGTRTHEARTWFHFERDTLYLTDNDMTIPGWMSAGPWDVDLYRPGDLQRVRNLALSYGNMIFRNRLVEEISGTLRLLPNLKALYLIAWENPDIDGRHLGGAFFDWPIPSRAHSLCIALDELDVVIRPPIPIVSMEPSVYCSLKMFKQNHAKEFPGQSYFDYMASLFREDLLAKRQKVVSHPLDAPIPEWNVPHIEFAHMCQPDGAQAIFNQRRRLWSQFLDTKRRLARGKRSRLKASKEKVGTSSKFQDVGEAFLRAHEPDEYERGEFYRVHLLMKDYYALSDFTLPVTREELWWLAEVPVYPPRFDIF